MPTPKPLPLHLSDVEREGLEKLIKRHTLSQQKALRGRIVLTADRVQNNSRVAREMKVELDTVRLWR